MKTIYPLLIFVGCTIAASGTTLTVETPGDLSNLISASQKYTITELKLTGKINGTDMLFLREMAGTDYDGYETDGQLAHLDISEAEIVEGGDSYAWDDFTGTECYAENNIVGQAWFCNCLALQTVVTPKSAVSIGQSAFSGCSSLEEVTIGSKIREIGEQAFYGTALESLSIPDAVEEIRSLAFSECQKLKTITIGAGLKGIDRPFVNTSSLENIFVDKRNAYFQDIDGVLTYDDGKILMAYPNAHSISREYTIPSSIEMIFNHAFYGVSGLDKLVFSSKVETIGTRAFEDCSASEIDFAEGLKMIGDYGFLNSGVTICRLPSTLTYIGSSAFFGCQSLHEIELPARLEEIGSGAFGSCDSLEYVSIPDELAILGEGMFAGASSLKSLTIGKGITNIPNHCFSDLYSLEMITLPTNIKSVEDGAFSNCTALKAIALDGNGLKDIGSSVFAYCSSLESFILPESLESIGSGAFSGCSSLKEIVIPNCIISIADNVFSYCEGLESVKLGEKVERLGNGVFSNCSSLKKIEWNECIRSIGNSSFSYCENMSLGQLPPTLEDIGEYAFSGLEVSEIFLPSSLKTIGTGAFGGWSDALASVTCLAKVPPICGENPFGFYVDYENITLSVPEESVLEYKNAPVWKEFMNVNGISRISVAKTEDNDNFDVYSIDGALILKQAARDMLIQIKKGIYIINGKKIML